MTEGFPRDLRLLHSIDYRAVLANKKRLMNNGMIAFIKLNQLQSPRLGLIVSKKEVSKAVWRNLLKRRIRESYRRNQAIVAGIDVVIMCKKQVMDLSRVEFYQCLEELWQKLALMGAGS